MADYGSMSDDELRAAYAREQQTKQAARPDYSSLSDDELRSAYLAEKKGQGLTVDNVVRSIAHGVPVIGGLADKIAAGGDAAAGPLVDSLAARLGFGPNASGTSTA